jgi:type II secretory pathway pseudopilin PulG
MLIELLVVMAIIAILAALILAGVMVFFRKGPEVKNRHELLQLSEALQNFRKNYGQYPPSRIRLRANIKEYQTKRVDALDDESVAFLALMWPQIAGNTTIQWAGGTAMPPAGFVLEGDQCLVFFLGGPPVGGGQPGLMGGFSTNPLNPIDKTNTNRKKDFDFEAARLYNRVGANYPFFSYYDVYGKQPFIYFSSNKRPNGYDPTANSLGVKPYLMQTTPTMQFYMPDSFQLISAGADGKFGPGGQWTEGNAGTIAPDGRDDVVQFRDKLMGIP